MRVKLKMKTNNHLDNIKSEIGRGSLATVKFSDIKDDTFSEHYFKLIGDRLGYALVDPTSTELKIDYCSVMEHKIVIMDSYLMVKELLLLFYEAILDCSLEHKLEYKPTLLADGSIDINSIIVDLFYSVITYIDEYFCVDGTISIIEDDNEPSVILRDIPIELYANYEYNDEYDILLKLANENDPTIFKIGTVSIDNDAYKFISYLNNQSIPC